MAESNNSRLSLPVATSRDVLTDILRAGAQRLLAQAIEAEVSEWIASHAELKNAEGHRQVVRNGHLPKRTITTGVGLIEVEQPRVLDRRTRNEADPFSSKILPPYLRKTKSLEELIPWLYLKGVSTGDFNEALTALVGPNCPGLSASDRHTTESMLGRRIPGMEQESLGREAVRLPVGRRRAFQHPLGRRSAVHPGIDGRHVRRPQRVDRRGRRLS